MLRAERRLLRRIHAEAFADTAIAELLQRREVGGSRSGVG